MTLPSLAESGFLLLQRRTDAEQARLQPRRIPRRVLQFRDRQPPRQSQKLLEHNRQLVQGAWAEYVFFDADAAHALIAAHATQEVLDAYDIASHPAMKCDVFRLCRIWKAGGYCVGVDLALRNRIEDVFDLRGDCVVFQWHSRDLTNYCDGLFGTRAGNPRLESALHETAASILNACRRNPDTALKISWAFRARVFSPVPSQKASARWRKPRAPTGSASTSRPLPAPINSSSPARPSE